MPIATPEVYAAMLDSAKANSYAFPAINITSSQTLNAALAGFAEAGSDGIIQVFRRGDSIYRQADLKLFMDMSGKKTPQTAEAVPLTTAAAPTDV